MFEPKRLHPISAVINFVKGLKDAAFPLIALVVLNGGLSGDAIDWIPLLVSSGLLLFILVGGIVKWLRFTYRIEEGELRIEYGLFVRKKRYIPIERIQSLDFSEGIFHRPFQLVKVSVETAGSSATEKAEAELTAIYKVEAQELEELIHQYKQADYSADEEEEEKEIESPRESVYEMRTKEIVLMAITSGGAGVVLSGVGVFFSQIMDALPLGAIYNEVVDWIQIGVLVVAFTALLILFTAYVISILLTLTRYANFRVSIHDEDLIITRGWLEKKQMTIPLKRIQGLRIDENLIRQPFGYASVTIISAGGGISQGAENQLRLLPFVKKENIPIIMEKILEDYSFDIEFETPPKRARLRYIIRQSWLFWLAVIPVSIFFFPLGLLSIVAALGATALGWLAYHDAGWNIREKQLTLRSRTLLRQTFIMKKYRIQSASKQQSILQKRIDLSSVRVALKSGAGGQFAECSFLKEEVVDHVLLWYRPEPLPTQPNE
ncbi:PH domain-containing protein [Halobacillus litoralis]|uniref:PH domain-containing protein n=1 Tax=Halobacillus litoralis TaxID=45668 RepID=UPI001CD222ED|nr:PH domain-containing protein [Halobacillus litoralis]MCA0969768.1 PH domain-containing protein [Halobacillus litoralis]